MSEKKQTTAIEKAKKAKATKNKYMLATNDALNASQVLYLLQKTNKKYVYKRKGKGNQEFEYVKGTYVKKVLNYTFGWLWDFEVKEHGREENQVWVLGKLTIKDKKGNPRIVKEQFGRADIKYYKDRSKGMLDYGNDLKSAATDSLKKCSSELGVASDVYNKEESQQIEFEQSNKFNSSPKKNVVTVQSVIKEIREIDDVGQLDIIWKQTEANTSFNKTQKDLIHRTIEQRYKAL